jgi:hypothetical protein
MILIIVNIKNVTANLKFFEFNVVSSTKLNMFSNGYEQMKEHIE